MPTVIRSINGARAAEEEARIADLTRSVVALRHDVEIATSRAAVFEAQCADMRKEREATALNRARAEVDVKVLREEHVRAQQRIEEVRAAHPCGQPQCALIVCLPPLPAPQ
ncbi:hypothetical protein EON66_03705 [archaeon]|nr:MAG: hypothetical protein EON66_03705 [archaeon]